MNASSTPNDFANDGSFPAASPIALRTWAFELGQSPGEWSPMTKNSMLRRILPSNIEPSEPARTAEPTPDIPVLGSGAFGRIPR
jgi:hypothetical protein